MTVGVVHWGTGATDGRWAFNNRLAEIDWGTRSVREVARVSRALVAAFHGRPAQRSYFAGCSTGGRQALVEAQQGRISVTNEPRGCRFELTLPTAGDQTTHAVPAHAPPPASRTPSTAGVHRKRVRPPSRGA